MATGAAAPSLNTAAQYVPSGQLVTFTLDGVEFGIDIDRVQEITPRKAITPVPGAPSFVEGVLNLRGVIIPVLDSRLRFHLAPAEPTHKTRIIVLDIAGQRTGLQVDSVSEVLKLEDFTLRPTPPLVAGVRAEYLAGMVMAGNRLITLINLDKILDSNEFRHRDEIRENLSAAQTSGHMRVELIASEDEPYVTFALGSESFGIHLPQVEEIIELPPITKVPDAPDYVLGVICLRDQVLPLIDLTEILTVQQEEGQAERNMVILLTFGESKIGIVVDAIQEIIRVAEDSILPPPQTLTEEECRHLKGVVLRPDRMVSLLDVMKVITGDDQAKLAAMGAGLGSDELRKAEQAVVDKLELVVFRLGEEHYSLRLHEVREIIMVGQITRVPRAPDFVEGVLNLRGEVIPVVDLRMRFGLKKTDPTTLSRILITTIAGVFTGLVVDTVEEVKSVDVDQLEPPPRIMTAAGNRFIESVARTATHMIFVVQLQQLLSESESSQFQNLQVSRKKG